jgi:hypothetical protein
VLLASRIGDVILPGYRESYPVRQFFCQLPIDGHLGDLLVLHTVRPAPQHLPHTQVGEILYQRPGQEDDVAFGDELVALTPAADARRQLIVGHGEAFTVATLEKAMPSQTRLDPV